MNYNQIKESPDGTVIKAFSGRVVKVYDPKQPTPAQAKAGIHAQGIILQNAEGESLDLRFISASQHLDRSSEGKLFQFQSMPANGKLDGVVVQRYQTKNGEERVSVKITKAAHYYEVDESTQELPPVAKVEPVQEKSCSKQCMRAKPTVGGLVSLFSSICRELELQLDGTKVFDSLISEPRGFAAAASTIFIESCKQGLQFEERKVIVNLPAPEIKNPVSEIKNPAPEKKEEVKSKINDLGDLAQYCISDEADPEKIIANAKRLKLKFSDIYDECFLSISNEYSDADVNAAWDSISKALTKDGKAPSSEQICSAIVTDWPSYITHLDIAKKFVNGKPE